MAITNHARRQDKPPLWAARGNLRLAYMPGGPSWLAVKIHMGDWNRAPEELLIASRYESALVETLAVKKFNAICLTWSPGFSHKGDQAQWEVVRHLLPLLKKKKIRAIAQITLATCFADELFRRAPQAAAWLKHDANGQPISNGDGQLLQVSASHPSWRQYLMEKVDAAIIAGFDGIFIDDLFCLYDEDEIAFMRELRDRARLQRSSDADDLLFYCHAFNTRTLFDTGNLINCDLVKRPGFNADGILKTNIGLFKTLFEVDGRDKPFVSGAIMPMSEAIDAKAQKLLLAEILANGGACCNFMLTHYQSFFAEHHALFSATDPINQIGLLISDESLDYASRDRNFEALCRNHPYLQEETTLARHNVQFDVLPARGIEHFDLNKYKLLCAFHQQTISAPVLEQLQAFVRHGGALLIAPGVSAINENQQARSLSDIFAATATMSEPLENNLQRATAFGAGCVIQYAPCDEAEASRQLLEVARKYGGPAHIEIQASSGIVALLWGKGTHRWVHIINYRAEIGEATIYLPGCGGRKLRVYSPDEPAPTLRVLDTGNACAAFILSNIETYSIVEII